MVVRVLKDIYKDILVTTELEKTIKEFKIFVIQSIDDKTTYDFNELEKIPGISETDQNENSVFDDFDYDLWVSSDLINEWMIEKYRAIKRQITSVLLENNWIPNEVLENYSKLQDQPDEIFYVLNSFITKETCLFLLKTYESGLFISKFSRYL